MPICAPFTDKADKGHLRLSPPTIDWLTWRHWLWTKCMCLVSKALWKCMRVVSTTLCTCLTVASLRVPQIPMSAGKPRTHPTHTEQHKTYQTNQCIMSSRLGGHCAQHMLPVRVRSGRHIAHTARISRHPSSKHTPTSNPSEFTTRVKANSSDDQWARAITIMRFQLSLVWCLVAEGHDGCSKEARRGCIV